MSEEYKEGGFLFPFYDLWLFELDILASKMMLTLDRKEKKRKGTMVQNRKIHGKISHLIIYCLLSKGVSAAERANE